MTTTWIRLLTDALGKPKGTVLQADSTSTAIARLLNADLAVIVANPGGTPPVAEPAPAPVSTLDEGVAALLAQAATAAGYQARQLAGGGSNATVTDASVAAQVTSGAQTQAALKAAFAPSQEALNTVAASGAAQTIPDPVTAQSISRITLSANCTLTFPTAAAGKSFTLVLVQDGTGSRTVTWPGTVKWAGGTAPTLSTGTGKVDYLSFVCTDGTNWAGFAAGLDVR